MTQVMAHIESVEDQEAARAQLKERRLVAFIANGAVLPRASGADDRVMREGGLPFASPAEGEVELQLPNRGTVRGLGIRQGVTLIVGGGFHGKSTLLEALQVGVFNHVPGDGREFVVTDPTATKVRAEDGRPVTSLDISAFISALPQQRDTTCFSSGDASGSTSQAANIVEALEVGSTTLLVDEDTCATNFMMRDGRMARLVESEPITPFLHRVRALLQVRLGRLHHLQERGVSTVLVAGSCGDFFDVADTVLKMQEYRCQDVTQAAKAIAADMPSASLPQVWPPPLASSL
jgi:predicted ABC-class ATPase